MPPVKSSDPRKAEFVAKVRAEFPHVSKVTDVREARGILYGEALEYDPGTRTYWRLGEVRVEDGRAVLADPTRREDYVRLRAARPGPNVHHHAWGWSQDDRPMLYLNFRPTSTSATLETLVRTLKGQGLGAALDADGRTYPTVTVWCPRPAGV